MLCECMESMETFIMPHEKMQVEVLYLCSDKLYLIQFYDISTGDKKLISMQTRYEREGYDYPTVRKEIKKKLCRNLHKNIQDSHFFRESEQLRNEIKGCLDLLTHKMI